MDNMIEEGSIHIMYPPCVFLPDLRRTLHITLHVLYVVMLTFNFLYS